MSLFGGGQQNTTNNQQPSLFGGGFGGSNVTPQPQNQTPSGSLFGNNQPQQQNNSGLFGQQTSFGFGGTNQNQTSCGFGSTNGGGGSLFGNLGNNNNQGNNANGVQPLFFGNNNNNPGGLFNNNNGNHQTFQFNPQPPPAQSLFGGLQSKEIFQLEIQSITIPGQSTLFGQSTQQQLQIKLKTLSEGTNQPSEVQIVVPVGFLDFSQGVKFTGQRQTQMNRYSSISQPVQDQLQISLTQKNWSSGGGLFGSIQQEQKIISASVDLNHKNGSFISPSQNVSHHNPLFNNQFYPQRAIPLPQAPQQNQQQEIFHCQITGSESREQLRLKYYQQKNSGKGTTSGQNQANQASVKEEKTTNDYQKEENVQEKQGTIFGPLGQENKDQATTPDMNEQKNTAKFFFGEGKSLQEALAEKQEAHDQNNSEQPNEQATQVQPQQQIIQPQQQLPPQPQQMSGFGSSSNPRFGPPQPQQFSGNLNLRPTQPQTAASSLFGTSQNQGAGGSGLFGAPKINSIPQQQVPSLFGGNQSSQQQQPQQRPGSLFSQSAPASSQFGASQPQQQNAFGPGFGSSNQAPSSSLFGGPAQNNQPAFGSSSNQASQGFGSMNQNQQMNSANNAKGQQSASLFSSPKSSQVDMDSEAFKDIQ